MSEFNIGIIGTRRRNSPGDYKATFKKFFDLYEDGYRIISGGCPKGGDNFAFDISKSEGIPITIFPANWSRYGKGAGFVRNTDIAENSDILIACVSKDRTGGTEDTIKKFLKFNKVTEIEAIEHGLLHLV